MMWIIHIVWKQEVGVDHVACFMCSAVFLRKTVILNLHYSFHILTYFLIFYESKLEINSSTLSETSIVIAHCKNAFLMKNSWDFHRWNVTMAAFFSGFIPLLFVFWFQILNPFNLTQMWLPVLYRFSCAFSLCQVFGIGPLSLL